MEISYAYCRENESIIVMEAAKLLCIKLWNLKKIIVRYSFFLEKRVSFKSIHDFWDTLWQFDKSEAV